MVRRRLPPLPDDILRTNILLRLPVKSVIRFRSVCSLWNSLIFEADFIKDHVSRTMQNSSDNNLIISYNMVEFSSVAILSLSDLSERKLFDVPSHTEIDILGSINGLVCLRKLYPDQYILWNPAIGRAMKISSPIRQFKLCNVTTEFFGFCWDVMENDFKVVITYSKKIDIFTRLLSSYMYSSNSGSWSLLPNFTFSGGAVIIKEPSTILNGVPYWKYYMTNGTNSRIIKFDVVSEEFSMLPELDVVLGQFCNILVNLKECLSVVVYNEPSCFHSLVDVHCFDERRGVWSSMYSVGPITSNVLSRFRYGAKIVFSEYEKYKYYDHRSNKIKVLYDNHERHIRTCFSYTASLIFLEGMKPLHQAEPILWK